MTTSTTSETAAGRAGMTAAGSRSDVRAARRSQVASVGMVLVLLAVSVFGVVESLLTGAAAEDAVAASTVSEDYWRAATAVAAEESLERKYRLEAGEGCGCASSNPRPRSLRHWGTFNATGTSRTARWCTR